MDWKETAKLITERVGGKSNIRGATYCTTRLRLTLADESLANDDAVSEVPGVISVVHASGQYQIIIGNRVPRVFQAMQELGILDQAAAPEPEKKKKSIPAAMMDALLGSMTPVIPAVIGCAMMKVLLVLLPMLGVLTSESMTYQVLTVIGDGSFYFLPILVAASAARYFKANLFLSITIAGILIHPTLQTLFSSGDPVSLFGIPVTAANYPYSILPAIIMAWVLSKVEKAVDRITPAITKTFLDPMLIVLICAPIALWIVGPAGAIAGDALSGALVWIQENLGWLAVGIIGGIYPVLVLFGMHHVLTPIAIASLSSLGFETIVMVAQLGANLAQGGASMAVALRSKNKNMRQTAAAAGFSALVAGITEPAMYGVTLRLKRPFIAVLIASFTSGCFAGLMQLKSFSTACPGLVTTIQYIEADRPISILYIALTCVIAIAVSFVLTLILGFRDPESASAETAPTTAAPAAQPLTTERRLVDCPMDGKLIPLGEVADETFASGVLGAGVALEPTDGTVYAPFDGTVETLLDSHHAIGLRSADGVELLVHIGRDTVALNGQHFTAFVKVGDTVKKGQRLLACDLDAVRAAGYDITTPVIVTNTDEFLDIVPVQQPAVKHGDRLLTIL
ncbi:MAG: beta-glucoside-specific PTS transporter subunit IIABC [Butyricicoccus pullicaecorum]|nr:beta-glucoside-specific PTS transporter subunit IIABC [Butyricicoccus pullicaecorum]